MNPILMQTGWRQLLVYVFIVLAIPVGIIYAVRTSWCNALYRIRTGAK